jgi:hypothetical protein
MASTILQNPFFTELVLPFLLVFTIVFAILQKSEILGKGKKQVDALTALAVGLIVVAFGNYVQIINQMSAFLGVALVIILVFLILTGAFYPQADFKLEKWTKMVAMGLVFIAVVIAVLVYTGAWNYLTSLVSGDSNSIVVNVVFVVILIGAVAAVIFSSEKSGSSGGSK